MAFDWGSVDWGSIANAGASLWSGNKQAKAAEKAGQQSAQASDAGNKLIWDLFQQNRADQEPFRQAGLSAQNEYMALLGLNPVSTQGSYTPQSATPTEWFGGGDTPSVNSQLYASDPRYKSAWDQATSEHQRSFGKGYTGASDRGVIQNRLQQLYGSQPGAQPAAAAPMPATSMSQQQAFDRFRSAPGYQFGLNEGQRTLTSAANASGGLFSGKAGKALVRYGQDYADQQGFTPYANRLASLAGIGQTATSAVGGYGQNAGANIASGLQSAGQARASGLLGSSQAWQQAIGNAGAFANDAYGYYKNGGR